MAKTSGNPYDVTEMAQSDFKNLKSLCPGGSFSTHWLKLFSTRISLDNTTCLLFLDAQRYNALVEHAGNQQTTSLLRGNLPNKYDATTVCLGEEKVSKNSVQSVNFINNQCFLPRRFRRICILYVFVNIYAICCTVGLRI